MAMLRIQIIKMMAPIPAVHDPQNFLAATEEKQTIVEL
jgi:hypothetical protein